MAILGIFELILGFIFRQNASVGSPEALQREIVKRAV